MIKNVVSVYFAIKIGKKENKTLGTKHRSEELALKA